MRIFSWVQNKFSGKQEEKKKFDAGSTSTRYTSVPDSNKEEIRDWPNTLLSIGTLGNQAEREEPRRHDSPENLNPSDDLPDFTVEEVTKLQKELTKLLTRKRKSSEKREDDRANLPLDRFLNCPSSLEVDRTGGMKSENVENENNGDLSPNTKLILNKVKDMLLGNRNSIKKKSISFLFKKMFVCSSGFAPAPSLRDPIPESRIEKILRAMLAKTIHTQSSAATSTKKYLENKPTEKRWVIEEKEKEKDQCKWVKTDSEFIVLEI